jgi:hypothetical protein
VSFFNPSLRCTWGEIYEKEALDDRRRKNGDRHFPFFGHQRFCERIADGRKRKKAAFKGEMRPQMGYPVFNKDQNQQKHNKALDPALPK